MGFLSAKSRIAFAQVLLTVSAVFAAMHLGIIPNRDSAVIDGRASVCETLEVACSTALSRNDVKSVYGLLSSVVERNPDFVSAAVRQASGLIRFQTDGHIDNWDASDESKSLTGQLRMNLYDGSKTWGAVELRFAPLHDPGVMGWIKSPTLRMIGFLGGVCFLLNYFYMARKLQHLDPSKAVPGRVRSALDTLTEGLLVLDKKSRVVLANEAFADFVKIPREKLVGRQAENFKWRHADSNGEEIVFPWESALADEKPQTGFTMGLEDGKGTLRTFMVNASPVLNPNGDMQGVLTSFEDVTQLEEAKKEMRKAKEAADEANHAKSGFLANMSHEIRTPMNAILGFTDVLRRGLEDDENQRMEHLGIIHSSGRHLLNLINDILDLSKIEAGKLELELTKCSPYEILAEVTSVMRVRAEEKAIALDFRTVGGVPETIVTDPTRLRQLVTNLVGNAIKFTDQGGVSIVARFERKGKKPKLCIDVSDSGIGMTREQQAKIFDPFTQADATVTRRFGGTGLGLSISKRIAEALGDGMTVQSKVGKGSTFTAVIDIGTLDEVRVITDEEAAQQQRDRREAQQVELTLPACRILVVDDAEANRKLMCLVLKRAGVDVHTAPNGKVAVEKAMADDFAIILMDMQMPIMDGYTATQTLRTSGYTKPIIALTADAMKGSEDRCREAGCSGFLTKPIDMDGLVQTLARVLSGQEERRRRNGFAGVHEAAPDIVEATATASKTKTPTAQPTEPHSPQPPKRSPTPQATSPAGAPAKRAATDNGPIVSEFFADDPEAREIIVDYVQHLSSQIGELREAWSAENYDEVGRIAHAIKGSAGTLGFDHFTAPAQELMGLAHARQKGQITAAIDVLDSMSKRVVVPGKEETTTAPQQNPETAQPVPPTEANAPSPKPTATSPSTQPEQPAAPADAPQPAAPRHPTKLVNHVEKLSEQVALLEEAWTKEDYDEVDRIAATIHKFATAFELSRLNDTSQTVMFLAKTRQMGQIDAAIEELAESAEELAAIM